MSVFEIGSKNESQRIDSQVEFQLSIGSQVRKYSIRPAESVSL